jgi:hypothetical protein
MAALKRLARRFNSVPGYCVVPDLPSPLPAMGAGRQSWRPTCTLAQELHAHGKLKLEEALIDASFTGAKKGVLRSGPPSAAKGRK